MLETITSVNGVVNGIVWGPIGLALLFWEARDGTRAA